MKNLFWISVFFLSSFSLFAQEAVPPQLGELSKKVESYKDIDKATQSLGIEAKLMNPHLSTTLDLSPYGLKGEGVHIPVQISAKYGGRQSMYYLKSNQTANTGIFMHENKMYFRNITRLTGKSYPAKTGDVYLEEVTDMNGKTIFKSKGVLKVLDSQKGMGLIEHDNPGIQLATSKWKFSILWSCISIEYEKAKEVKVSLK